MKNNTKLILIIVFLQILFSIEPLKGISNSEDSYTTITSSEANKLIQNGTIELILDVRTASEYCLGHISNASLITSSEIDERKDELPSNLSTPILIYCKSGTRSATVSSKLASEGYSRIFNMKGGFSLWSKDFPYDTGGSPSLTECPKTSNTSDWYPIPILFGLLIAKKKRKRLK